MNDLYQNKGEEVQTSFSFSSDVLAKALQRIYGQKMDVEGEIEPNLFHEICRILDDAAADGVAQSEVKQVDDFLQQLQTNNEVFAAFKVHRMQRDMARLLLDSNGTLKPFEKWVQEVTPIASHQVRHWLQTEYDTAVLRAHQAADWQQFLRERDVLPNLKWMPSTFPAPGGRSSAVLEYHTAHRRPVLEQTPAGRPMELQVRPHGHRRGTDATAG